MNSPRLCLFSRAPERGKVKTRLARAIGEDAALDAHQRLTEWALERFAHTADLRVELWLAGNCAMSRVRQWGDRFRVPIHPQVGDDLGQRMFHALTHETGSAMILGCDCPAVDRPYVLDAVAALRRSDLVVGPAEDGGYVLIGQNQPEAELFHEMRWGSDRVLAVTLERATRLSLRVTTLATAWDVDDAQDWSRACAAFPILKAR